MNLAEYRQRFGGEDNDAAPGWDAIDARLKEVYGDQEPRHWGTTRRYILGGPDPLDGISAYECRDGGIDHLHYVTYGYSFLYYEEESAGAEYSGYGFEMTFRPATSLPPATDEWKWVFVLLQNLARYVFDSGRWFSNDHWIRVNGPIRYDSDTTLTGLAFVTDPVLGTIDTPHGRVAFVQAFGITQKEVDALMAETRTCKEIVEHHRATNPLLVTDLARRDD